MKLTAIHADTCLSCYWGGHHLPHLQVAVWKGMTLDELKQALKVEMRDGCFGGSDERTRDDHDEFEVFYEAARVAIDDIFSWEKPLFNDLEPRPEDDDGEEVYAFFVFVEEDEG